MHFNFKISNKMNIRPLISIILPTFNRPHYLSITLDSVLSQVYDNFEVIVCDNSDNEDSEKVIKKYNDERIFYFHNKENLGAEENYNKCLTLAKGDYFHFLCDDDILLPNCLQEKVELINSTKAQFVFSKFGIIDLKNVITEYEYIPDSECLKNLKNECSIQGLSFDVYKINKEKVFDDLYFRNNLICLPSVIISKEIFKEFGFFNAKLPFIPDWDYWLRITQRYDAFYIDETQVYYRVHPQNFIKGATYREYYKQLIISKEILNYENKYLIKKGVRKQLRHLKKTPFFKRVYNYFKRKFNL
jgi:glycosyltransferase involved in cell wall biosynthesis